MKQESTGLETDFVIIANDWAAGRDNPTSKHRIAHELARRGARVLWMEGSVMRRPSLSQGSDRSRIWRKIKSVFAGPRPAADIPSGRIHVLTPPLLPLSKLSAVRHLNGFVCRWWGRFWAWRLGFRKPALINYVPVLAETMPGWKGRKLYHCVDRWDAFAMYDSRLMEEMDARCCRYADVVAASSQDLYERCLRHNRNVKLVLHGVDHAHFSSALHHLARPQDLPPGPVIGFFGLLSEWLDQESIAALARQNPGLNVVLIGKADVNIDRLRGIANLHLLGPRPFGALPAYIAHFEVGVIPFLINDLTRAVNPIKLREMLSAGCPVVSTAMPEVERYASSGASGVDVAHNPVEFLTLCRQRTQSPATAEERARISRSMEGETWAAKVEQLLAAMETV